MILYLINFVLCSGLLLLVYKLFLQNERMYRFNRFYLLFCLAFSLTVPLISIVTHTQTIPVSYQRVITQAFTPATEYAPVKEKAVQQIEEPAAAYNYLPLLLLASYGMVAVLLIIRFAVNLYRIKRTVTQSEAVQHQHTQLILTDEQVTPHSFLKYVFVNRNDYREGAVEPQIICHEQTHARQLHSVDVLLVELIQAVCWFNPFIPFYRRAIQLNHEFLADEAVIDNSFDTVAYQYLLLAKASQANSLQLTSQFNYLTTKKRLLMMTKTTSAKMALGKQLIVLPVIAAAVFLFSQKTEAEILPPFISAPATVDAVAIKKDTIKHDKIRFALPNSMRTKYSTTDAPEKVMTEYTAILKKYNIPDGDGRVKDITADDKARLHALFIQMSKGQQDSHMLRFTKASKPFPKNKVTVGQLAQWQQDAKKYGVWVNEKRIKNADLANYTAEDFDHLFYSRLTPLAVKNDGFHFQVDLMTKPYYADYYKKTMANQEDQIAYWHIINKRTK